ncbi:MAG: diguanylate cyclase [Anaerolineae bacterium]|nr:ABC transporter permease [Anaerolineales bacterium]MCQ3973075.1 diguanylate cyclase [Anaerolineae bacterium]
MTQYILRRLLQAIPLLLIITFVLFLLTNNMGDPLATLGGRQRIRAADRERLMRQFGLDQPIAVQYLYWLVGNDWTQIDKDGDGVGDEPGKRKGVIRGDFGTSIVTRRPALDLITERLPNTLLLMLPAEVLIIFFSLVVGVYSALRQYSWVDNLLTSFSFIGYSMPVFWLALMMMYVFAVNFKAWGLPYFPTVGMFEPEAGKTIPQILWHLVLPVATLTIISVAGYSRYVRASMLEVINQDYIRTARAKGLPRRMVIYGHALKNASLPLVTIVGLDLPLLLAGAIVTESIFAWPGMGRLFIDHTERADIAVIMGIMVMISVAVVFFQIVTDLVYAYLDPRIHLA